MLLITCIYLKTRLYFKGLITTKGLTFRTGTEGDTMVTAGPITRYAEDITPILRTLLGENQQKLKLGEKVFFITVMKSV